MALEEVDLIVIGSGQGGVPLAVDRAQKGQRVVLFERGELGGTCVNTGCTPSKTLLASAHNAGRARLAGPLGVHADVRVDQRAVFERVRRVRADWNGGIAPKLEKAGVEIVRASAAFSGERTVRGGGRELRATTVVIDTGASAAVPPVEGLEGVPYLTNQTFFDQTELPKRLLVIGGGYIGLELGQGAQRLGSAVTIVHGQAHVMDREEPDASDCVRAGMERDGVVFKMSAQAKRVERAGEAIRLTLSTGETVEGDGLLVATGRTPNTKDLAADKTGVELAKNGSVAVDDYLRTTCPGIFALGDVAGQPAFTHVSWEDFRRIRSTLDGTPRKRDDRVLSYTTFTEPQLARTGLTEADAKKKGMDARSVTLQLSDTARGAEWDLELGFYRLVVDAKSDKMLGATMVGYETGELVHVIAFAIELGATWRDLDAFVGIHPTFGEALPSLARLLE
ncbi:MAG: FAD-dependent oxidoreductase [Candidatus Eremiobacteraeota bacterium]|nr:FAD-dependent oxidoreductase [Candidatus Eremiobacteraeota bacterium]